MDDLTGIHTWIDNTHGYFLDSKLKEESQVKLQAGVVELNPASQVDLRPVFIFRFDVDSQGIKTNPNPHMFPRFVFHGGSDTQDRSRKILILYVKDLGACPDAPAWCQGDIHTQPKHGQRGRKIGTCMLIDKTTGRQPLIDRHDI